MKKSIVVMMAHADDIEISAGGTLARYISKGYRALYGVLTRCNSGWSENEAQGGHYEPSVEIVPKRKTEAQAAAKVFGAEFYMGSALENCYTRLDGVRVFPSFEGVEAQGTPTDDIMKGLPIIVAAGAGYSEPTAQQVEMTDLLIDWEPEIVICQAFQDWNPDHYAAALLLVKAWQAASEKVDVGSFWIPVRMLSGGDWPDFPPMKPDHFEDVTGFEETVLKAFACHVSQGMDLPKNQDLPRKKWTAWGEHAGCKSAEAFVRIGPWKRKA